MESIIPLDLNFQGFPGVIAAYLLPHTHGAALVESGPGSTQDALQNALAVHGFLPADITDLFLTHIHLDHAGAAGWLANQGAHVYVHEAGAPHLLDPTKLLASARRIYGEHMDALWGEFLPVPADRLTALRDEDVVQVGRLCLRALDTPGHANHHMAYLFEDVIFSGDIGGVRVRGLETISVPMPPPELHLEKWRQSAARLAALPAQRIAPTHFGLYSDPANHLARLVSRLEAISSWIEQAMPSNPAPDQLEHAYTAWVQEQDRSAGLSAEQSQAVESVNPAYMSAAGIQRYWQKIRQAKAET